MKTFLFDYNYRKYPCQHPIGLFDLTDFYFEGCKEKSEKAHLGRSKEKRSDARLISPVLLTDANVFYYGNIPYTNTMDKHQQYLLSQTQMTVFVA